MERCKNIYLLLFPPSSIPIFFQNFSCYHMDKNILFPLKQKHVLGYGSEYCYVA